MKSNFLKSCLLGGVLLWLAGPALGGDSGTGHETGRDVSVRGANALSIDALIGYALNKNPEILAAKAEWLAAKKRIWTDSALSDPMAGLDIMGSMVETRTGPQDHRFAVSQDIPFPLKLVAKGKIAAAQARAAYQKYRAVQRDVVSNLKKFYYELYYLDASIQTLEETKELLKKIEAVAQARYSNLSGSQRDVAKAQAEISMSLEKLYMLKQQRETVVAMIHALLDEDPMSGIGPAKLPPVPELKLPLVDLVNLAVQNRQEIKEAKEIVAKSGYAKRLAQLAYIPDLNAGFEYTWLKKGETTDPMDGRDSWMFPLRFTVPLWQNRIIPEILEAKNEEEASRAKLLRAKNAAFYEVKDAYYRFDAATKIARLYETAVIPQAEIALKSD